jgi:choloylglycine hydrolase
MNCFIRILILGALAWFSDTDQLLGCTGFMLTAKDKSFVHGRTLEFGIPVDTSIAIIPRNYEFHATTSKGAGLTYLSKYGVIGAVAFDNPSILDGMNEKGLSIGTFYFPGFAKYSELTKETEQKSLSPTDFPNWIITQFETVDEIKAAIQNIQIVPTVIKGWGDETPPFHYVVYDKNGKSIVIEPVDGKLIIHDNPFGVLTNSPNFDWHVTNLRNYINLSTFNAKPLEIHGVELKSFGQGSGMVGMPGDFTPPSRFVRAVIYSAMAIPLETSAESVYQAFHILNQFDIPIGAIREESNGKIFTDSTLLTCVRDPKNLKYYFKSYEDQTIKVVDLSKFDLNAKAIRYGKISGNGSAIDITSTIK